MPEAAASKRIGTASAEAVLGGSGGRSRNQIQAPTPSSNTAPLRIASRPLAEARGSASGTLGAARRTLRACGLRFFLLTGHARAEARSALAEGRPIRQGRAEEQAWIACERCAPTAISLSDPAWTQEGAQTAGLVRLATKPHSKRTSVAVRRFARLFSHVQDLIGSDASNRRSPSRGPLNRD